VRIVAAAGERAVDAEGNSDSFRKPNVHPNPFLPSVEGSRSSPHGDLADFGGHKSAEGAWLH
jgi:hypothetical protein